MRLSKAFSAVRPRKPRRWRTLAVEGLERREMMSSTGWVPEKISIPIGLAANASSFNSSYQAKGSAAITSNEIDYYRFQAPEKGVYQVSATTPSSNMDTVLGVFDSTGKRLAYNDDISGTNRDSQTTAMFDKGSIYFFAITNFTGTPGGSYQWEVRRTDDFYEGFGGDTKQTAINLGQVASRRVQPGLVLADGNDWFQFYLPATPSQGKVEIRFEHDLGDLDMALYNASGTQVGWSQGTGDKETLSLPAQPAGQYYYIHVYGHAGASNPFYTLDVNPWGNGFQIDVSHAGFTAAQQAMIRQAADRWEQIITNDLPAASFSGQTVDDLLINVTAVTIDGGGTPGNGNILGRANCDQVRSNKGLPFHGFVEMDSFDVTGMVNAGDFLGTVVHEMGHVLGIGTLWSSRNLLTGATGSDPRFTGQQATKAYNQIFGRSDAGVPVEATGGAGTALSHWRESLLGVEMMTGWNNAGVEPVSRITVGSLVDLGYSVDWAAAETFVPNLASSGPPTGGSWWGNITQWNPASVAAPWGAENFQSAGPLDQGPGAQTQVCWNALPSATSPELHFGIAKLDGEAILALATLDAGRKTESAAVRDPFGLAATANRARFAEFADALDLSWVEADNAARRKGVAHASLPLLWHRA